MVCWLRPPTRPAWWSCSKRDNDFPKTARTYNLPVMDGDRTSQLNLTWISTNIRVATSPAEPQIDRARSAAPLQGECE